jgi:hypothetical protein
MKGVPRYEVRDPGLVRERATRVLRLRNNGEPCLERLKSISGRDLVPTYERECEVDRCRMRRVMTALLAPMRYTASRIQSDGLIFIPAE